MRQETAQHSRGYLIHWDRPGARQFVTWRLADSLPADVAEQYRIERDSPDMEVKRAAFRKVEEHLDRGIGSCVIGQPVAARRMVETLFEKQEGRYQVQGFVVMPNHVHALLRVAEDSDLKEVMKLIKGSSARTINEALRRRGRLWQPDYFDRMIRDEDHFTRALHYIHWNPVKAKLSAHPEHYAYSSANPRMRERLLVPD